MDSSISRRSVLDKQYRRHYFTAFHLDTVTLDEAKHYILKSIYFLAMSGAIAALLCGCSQCPGDDEDYHCIDISIPLPPYTFTA